MNKLIKWFKDNLPKPLKTLLKPVYHQYLQWRFKRQPKNYQQQKNDEINRFNLEEEVNNLPDIFHYWTNKYLVPKFQKHGFTNPNQFFLKYAVEASNNNTDTALILSIGSGNCDTEVTLAKDLVDLGHQNFFIECMDINRMMFERGKKLAASQGVENKIGFLEADFNQWKASKKYHLIIANQSLHHVVELEHLFDNINLALNEQGQFITSDVIGKNGHQRWPEALKLMKPIWKNMPDRYKYNHAFKRIEKKFINHDCSTEGFEGIRAQDVLPLLIERFEFELFIPFANIIMVFIDRSFGPNFDPSNAEDLAFIDHIHDLDEMHMIKGTIKPTQMLAVLHKKTTAEHHAAYSGLSPNQATRHPDL